MGKLFRKKKDEVTLSPDAASQMLSNVFEACDYEANRVPLEVLQSYSNYRRERHLLQRHPFLHLEKPHHQRELSSET